MSATELIAETQSKFTPFDDGVVHGMALAAAMIVRKLDNPTIALEVLGAAGIERQSEVHALHLDDYDAEPLLRIVTKR